MIPSIIISLLSVLICLQWKFLWEKSTNLKLLRQRLHLQLHGQTWDKLLLHTSDKDTIALLNELNELLDIHYKKMAEYQRMEGSIKKMIANISHDIKTPLTVILGYIERIHADPQYSHGEISELLTTVDNKAHEVLELINKFFDLIKLESGDKELPLSKVDIFEICRKNVLEFYTILTGKGFEVQLDLPEEPVYVLGNTEALDRILTNLLSNAIRHGGDGKVLGLAARSDSRHVFIEVWDRGKGIDIQQKDLVFERLYTLEDSRNKSYQGSGLGLTITKKLVERMGGTISLSSVPLVKTIFTIQMNRLNYAHAVVQQDTT